MLASLSVEDLEEFCIGDQENIDALASCSKELTIAANLLEAFFEHWLE